MPAWSPEATIGAHPISLVHGLNIGGGLSRYLMRQPGVNVILKQEREGYVKEESKEECNRFHVHFVSVYDSSELYTSEY